ncbi:MAG: hypothetical protein HYU66_05200, partial [Armatimonadetes bacterium]|nr:hypothetical protein [Armatimonadota bacterium]
MRRLALLLFALPLAHAAPLDFAGTWGVKLDPADAGVTNTRPADFAHLARKVEYTGAAWYQREVVIPADWRGKRAELLLERCHWTTHAWLDERDLGEQVSLCTPHLYDLGTVRPGRHRLTLCVDNRMHVDVGGWAHSVTEETQTNWNGVIGRMELRATDTVWIERVQVYPDPASHRLRVRLLVGNATRGPQRGSVAFACGRVSRGVTFIAGGERAIVEADLELPADTPAWDEFHPELLTLTADLSAGTWRDRAEVTFGLRKLEAVGRRLELNGRTIFLRGTLECCVFPRTG